MLVITAAVFLLFSASRASLDDDLLLVNGEVTTSSIRILLEDTAATDNRSLHYTVCRQVRHHPERPMLSEGSHVFQLQVNRPSVLQLPKLTACSDYHVRFSYSNQSLHCGQTIPEIDVTNVVQSSFRTICDETEDFRFVVLSCDRFADDWTTGNDEFVQNYVAKIKDFDVAFHMGDQIYADQLLNLDYSNVEQVCFAFFACIMFHHRV